MRRFNREGITEDRKGSVSSEGPLLASVFVRYYNQDPMHGTELRAHTAFSFNDGAVTPEALVQKAADLGHHTIGITDTADLGGSVRFALECRRQGIKPVVGVELNVEGRPAAFIAKNAEGFRNIASLVTRSRVGSLRGWVKGQSADRRGRPRVSFSEIAERSAGVIALTGPGSGPIGA